MINNHSQTVPAVSVIVPVYNVEEFLPKCLDSILDQTCKDLEILLIDDGSTDRSGEICDQYTEKDDRIRVFHTANHGLSAARNLGLDHCTGEYIEFVDSDDWIESNMIEALLQRAEETGADIAECGYYREYPNKTAEKRKTNGEMSGQEAVQALVKGELNNYAWDKLYRRHCFEKIRFPAGRVYEDVATTYKVLALADKVCVLDLCLYHYRYRKGSLSRVGNMETLSGSWLSYREQYDDLADRTDEAGKQRLLGKCEDAAARVWEIYYELKRKERAQYRSIVEDINAFSRRHFPAFGNRNGKMLVRTGVFLSHYLNGFSLLAAFLIRRANESLHRIRRSIIKKFGLNGKTDDHL